MTDPVLQLAPSSLTIAPGAQGRATLTVENVGSQVERFQVELLGAAAAWARAQPEALEVYPGTQQQAVIAFSAPPVGAVPTGSFPFGVRAVSLVDHYSADVAEGSVQIGPVSGLAPSLTPVTSSGRWKGRHVLTVSNWGNTQVSLRLVARDADERLGFLVRPAELDLPLGATRAVRLTVRTRRPSLRAAQQRLPFSVVGEPLPVIGTHSGSEEVAGSPGADRGRLVVDGAFVQRPILSRAVVSAAVLLVLACAAATALLLRGQAAPTRLDTGFRLPPPVGVSATPDGSSTIRLLWERNPSAVSYRVVEVDAQDTISAVQVLPPVDGALRALEVADLAPLTEHCFTVAAVSAAGANGRATQAACATTEAPRGSGDLPAPTEWIVIRSTFVTLGSPAAEPDAVAERARLAAAEGIRPGLLDSGAYPELQPVTRGRAWVVYEGPFETQADAELVCGQRTRCRAARAGARQDAPVPSAAPAPSAPAPAAPAPPAATAPTQPSAAATPTAEGSAAP